MIGDPEDFAKRAHRKLDDEIEARFDRVYDQAHNELDRALDAMQQPLPEGFHGRWRMLTVEDVKFLDSVGIEIDN